MIDGRYPKGSKIIVGVSGGADSVALLDMLVEEGMQCVVAHCQFHLRGEESERDARFVQDLSEKYHIPFFRVDFQTEAYAQVKGLSIEMAARELRYDWFDELMKREKAVAIAIAHHADDRVETFLMNLTRGTGLRGLTGIKSTEKIWRPMLHLSRREVLAYLQERTLPHVEDSTNAETHYTRNKFRNSAIPMMEQVNSRFKDNVLKTIEHLRQTEEFLQAQLKAKRVALFHAEGEAFRLNCSELLKEECLPYLLYELLSPYGFSATTIAELEENVRQPKSGKMFFSSRYAIFVERDSFLLKRSDDATHESDCYLIQSWEELNTLPVRLHCESLQSPVSAFDRSPNVCYLDAEKVRFPLEVRRWQSGDWFVPFGMKGKKKLSDFFVDQRLSVEEKKQIWLLLSDGRVVWVIGKRSDDRFRVDETTRSVLKIRCDV